jgi:transketolase
MGATHHALEDYGSLLCLPHIRAYVPAFDVDVKAMASDLFSVGHPAYFRLGLSEEPKDATVPPYACWRKLQDGPGWVIVVTGSLAGSLWGAARDLEGARRPSLWLLSVLPALQLPEELRADLARSRRLLVVEEHVAQGGVAQNLATLLLESGKVPERFASRSAQGYLTGRYGSQQFHRRECGLDSASILDFLATQDS